MRDKTRAYALTVMRNLRQDINARSVFIIIIIYYLFFIFFIEVSWPDEYEEDSLEDKG